MRINKIIGITIPGLAVIGVLLVGAGIVWMKRDVANSCKVATSMYVGDCVEASIALLFNGEASIRQKNSTIWALGQMADKRALPILKSLYSGSVPEEREPLDQVISQYELSKAIKWIENGNITSWMYK